MPKKYPAYIKAKAVQLRVDKKMTVPDIASHLKIAKSTIHGWLQNYPLKARTDKQTQAQKNGTRAMQAKYQALRDAAYNAGWDQAPQLFKDPFFRDFINMYLAEGFKKTSNVVTIANSDPNVMLMAQHFILKYTNTDNRIEYRIQLHADQDEKEIKQYWGNLMGIQPCEINIQRKSNSGQ